MRVALVTGATSGIGEATARLFVKNGMAVVAGGRGRDRLDELVNRLSPDGGEIVAVPGDLTDPSTLPAMFEAAVRQWGQEPNVAVLSAGRGLAGTVLSSDPARWAELAEVNYLSVLRQLRECAGRMARDNAPGDERVADIVVLGSTVGRQVSAANPVYGSTKFAVHSLVDALRQEVCRRGVRVSLVEPGFVRTGFQRAAGYDPVWFEEVARDNGPLLTGEDVAAAIAFVVGQPAHVHIDDVRIRPTRQQA
jgi:NADP-dependent 3-hydroxy acid dehydrogenase YdfG